MGVNPTLWRHEASLLCHAPNVLDEQRRGVVERIIFEVCQHRSWTLQALNVRTNHVHVVVSAPAPPEQVMTAFKAWSTRRLREAGLAAHDEKLWSRHGSTRYLWSTTQVEAAIHYTEEGQGR